MSSDTAAVPEPVVVPPPAAPAAPMEAPAVDPVVKIAEEIAGMYNVVDWKKPVPTALAVFAHVSTMTSLTGEQRLKAVQHVITTIAKRGGTSEDEGSAKFFADSVLPHILAAIESLTAGKIPSVEAVKDFAQTEMKAVAPVVIAELKKVSGWCGW
jgi:hypothetical protein